MLTPGLIRHIITAALVAYPDPALRDPPGLDPPIIGISPVEAASLLVRFDDETVALVTITAAAPES